MTVKLNGTNVYLFDYFLKIDLDAFRQVCQLVLSRKLDHAVPQILEVLDLWTPTTVADHLAEGLHAGQFVHF